VSNSTAWITVTAGSSGTGNGTVTYNVAALTSTTPRTGTLTIAGRTLTVTQSGVCSFALASTAQTAPAAGGPLTTSVTTATGCTWATVSNASWITVTSPGSITSSGTAGYTVGINPAATSRSGTLTIAGQTVTITQTGNVLPPGRPTNVRVTH
jgi:hypothetical protein